MHVVVAAFYQFAALSGLPDWQARLQELGARHGLRGTILLAPEGINATVSGTAEGVAELLDTLRADPALANLAAKESRHAEHPFKRFKVRLKREIITLGVPAADPTTLAGTYVEPRDWNRLISDPDVTLIDTRNAYEVAVGTFPGALNPGTRRFSQFPDFVRDHLDPGRQRKVAMFCTGGIRCEKATALLRQQGFAEVYHLRGGILKYLEEVPAAESRWQGECFVFDERVALDHSLGAGDHALCFACGHPLSPADRQDPAYEPGISCPQCRPTLTPERRARFAERLRQRRAAARD